MTERKTQATFVAAMLGSGVAELVTLPTDIAKVRLQVQVKKTSSLNTVQPEVYTGMIDCLGKVWKFEGPSALWKGWQPALLRQCCYTTLSMILYEEILRTAFNGKSKTELNYFQRLLTGGTAGALSIFVFNWTEVLKTQMQTSNSKNRLKMSEVFLKVYKNEGLTSFLMSGVKPNIMRTFLVNAAEIGTYDHAKTTFFIPLFGDNALSHISASGVAGVASACVSTPADVIKTRLMNNAGSNRTHGVIQVFNEIARNEGYAAFYKGFAPICVRKVIWCSVFFVSFEQLKLVFA